MRVMGLDPGLACAGFGVVEQVRGALHVIDYGAIRTPPGDPPSRLGVLYIAFRTLIEAHQPEAVAVERVLFNANARTAMSVGQAAGVALLTASQAGCDVAEYTPGEVKLTVTGYGSATKLQVQQMVTRLLQLPEQPDSPDAADALGLAITHLHTRKLRELAKEAISSA
jgi:crossover junction endodeoxyribonuclease RuvC